jgi:TM2 domain-containing membrane protein YozV
VKNKTVAALLALFLGGIGIHKFYLGRGGQGILFVLFCWTFFPAIIGFFEFFVLLFMSEHNFNLKYNGMATGQPAQQIAQQVTVNIPSNAGGGSVAVELEKLQDLRTSGVLTEEEFAAQKTKLLS